MKMFQVHNFSKKVKFFYSTFIVPPKVWKLPSQCDVLIYDEAGADLISGYLQDLNFDILAIRGLFVNIPCLFLAMMKKKFWRGEVLGAYSFSYIEAVGPKVIITFIDNNQLFYTFSSIYPSIKTIFVQNGLRGGAGDIFASLKKMESYHVDFMLVFNRAFGKKYQEFISGEFLTLGSLKNNKIALSKKKKSKSVVFISQFRSKPIKDKPLIIAPDGKNISWEKFFSADIATLHFLKKWCERQNVGLSIAGCSGGKQEEYFFFEKQLVGSNWEFIPNKNQYDSYNTIDSCDLVVSVDSALGFESLGRGNKTACFSTRAKILNDQSLRFAWPAEFEDFGRFWTNEPKESEFERIMNYLLNVSDKEWEDTLRNYAEDLMDYDPDNSKLVGLIDRLLTQQRIKINVN